MWCSGRSTSVLQSVGLRTKQKTKKKQWVKNTPKHGNKEAGGGKGGHLLPQWRRLNTSWNYDQTSLGKFVRSYNFTSRYLNWRHRGANESFRATPQTKPNPKKGTTENTSYVLHVFQPKNIRLNTNMCTTKRHMLVTLKSHTVVIFYKFMRRGQPPPTPPV